MKDPTEWMELELSQQKSMLCKPENIIKGWIIYLTSHVILILHMVLNRKVIFYSTVLGKAF